MFAFLRRRERIDEETLDEMIDNLWGLVHDYATMLYEEMDARFDRELGELEEEVTRLGLRLEEVTG